jgi:hypothetical protein
MSSLGSWTPASQTLCWRFPQVRYTCGHFLYILPVLRIRIHRIHMFLGLQDLDPDPLVRGMDPDPSIIKHKILRKSWFLLFCDFFLTVYLWKMMRKYLQKVICRQTFYISFCRHLEGDEKSRIRIRIRIHYLEAWIPGSGSTPKCHGSATLHITDYVTDAT